MPPISELEVLEIGGDKLVFKWSSCNSTQPIESIAVKLLCIRIVFLVEKNGRIWCEDERSFGNVQTFAESEVFCSASCQRT